jgi:hypothetical protein
VSTGIELKDAGIRTAIDNPRTPPWKAVARQVIIDLALEGLVFTSEDVRRRAGDPPTNNVMGAMLNVAARHGVIRRVGYRTADRPTAHARVITEWTAGHAAHDALQAWPSTGTEGLSPTPVDTTSEPRWQHSGCGAIAGLPGEATVDERYRVGACPSCHRRDAIFTLRKGA